MWHALSWLALKKPARRGSPLSSHTTSTTPTAVSGQWPERTGEAKAPPVLLLARKVVRRQVIINFIGSAALALQAFPNFVNGKS